MGVKGENRVFLQQVDTCPQVRWRTLAGGLITLILTLLWPGIVLAQSALQTTADAMAPDTWAILTTNGINDPNSGLIMVPSASGEILGDGNEMVYDPITQAVYFIGMAHNAANLCTRFVKYDLATNTWSKIQDLGGAGAALPTDLPIPCAGAGNFINHSWDGTTIDVRGRSIYRRNGPGTPVFKWNIDTHQWSQLPDMQTYGFGVGFAGLAWNYERGQAGRLQMSQLTSYGFGMLAEYDPVTNTWSQALSGVPGYPGATGQIDCLGGATYSPARQVTFFGCTGNPFWHIMNAGGVRTQAANFPDCTGGAENRNGLTQYDPVTGNFVMLCGATSRSWHIFDPVANTWATKPDPLTIKNHILNNTASPAGTTPSPDPADTTVGPTWQKVGVAITDHGVIMWISCASGGPCLVRLYKGGTGPTPVPPVGVLSK